MHLIPVIDLLDNQVVHAKRGEREHYQAIQSSLCSSSAPIDIIAALLQLYPFNTIYIADLNAIQKRGNHLKVIETIQQQFPQLCIWLDAGISSTQDLNIWNNTNIHWVIGTESLSSMEHYHQLQQMLTTHFTLSLDFNKNGYQGPAELINQAELWPKHIIAMTLTKVGSNEGADIQTLQTILKQHSHINLYAAGGIRSIQDLQELSAAGLHGALVATALHKQHINQENLKTLKPL